MKKKNNYSYLWGHRALVLILGMMALWLSYLPQTQQLDDWLFELYTQVLPEENLPSQTVLVTIDDLLSPSSGTLSHSRLAALIDSLDAARVAAIGLLQPLIPQQDEEELKQLAGLIATTSTRDRAGLQQQLIKLQGDQQLVRALEKSSRVVLVAGTSAVNENQCWLPESQAALTVTPSKQHYPAGIIQSPEKPVGIHYFADTTFTRAAAASGSFCQPSDKGPVPLVLNSDQGYIPGFILQLQILKVHAQQTTYLLDNQAVVTGDAVYNTGPGYRLYMHPDVNTTDTIRNFTATELIGADNNINFLVDKVVFIGLAGDGLNDDSYPLISGLPPQPVNEVYLRMSHAIDSLSAQRYYSSPEWLYAAQRAGIIAVLLYLLVLPQRFHGLFGVVINFIIVIVLANMTLMFMLSKNSWVPLSTIILLLMVASFILLLRHRITSLLVLLRHETAVAYRELAHNYQTQGQLDTAYEYLSRCPVDKTIAEPLYHLGMDYERRRQFSKAMSVYSLLAQFLPGYRDIDARTEKLSAMPTYFPQSETAAGNAAMATMIMDDVMIARPVIGRYEIERELGRGAMGMVYVGKDPKIGRVVAIKTLALADEFEQSHLDEVKRRFYQEAETAGQLNHPAIVTIYDVGEEHDLAYIAMDFIKGKSLDYYTRADSLLPIAEVFDIGIVIAEALDYAHNRKVVHRDVKPANMMYDRDNRLLKVTDFGIACLTDHSKTRTGTVLGSPFYMSPEQIAGHRVDGRSDLFSLAVTLYQLLTGHLPFSADSLATLMYRISNDRPASIRSLRKDLPSCLTHFMNRALEKNVVDRFQTGTAFADALYNCAERAQLVADMRVRR